MSTLFEFELNDKLESYEFGKLAKQANGSVLLQVGDCVVLAAVVSEFDNPCSEDFTPLTVQYIEKYYAGAKLPGGFIKREGKPSDFETLTSRIIDRSLRPLFPKGYNYPTTITVMVLSADKEVDLQSISLNAASAALFYSDLPISKSVCGIKLAKIAGKFVINPSLSQMRQSTLELFLAGTKDEILMIEMKAISSEEIIEIDIEAFSKTHSNNELNEDELIEAIEVANEALKEANISYEKAFSTIAKDVKKLDLDNKNIDEKILQELRKKYGKEIKEALAKLAKSERANQLKELSEKILANDFADNENIDFAKVYELVSTVKKEFVRSMILDDNIRADGRKLDEVRNIEIETNILPQAHSSCLFTRGQTQALVVATLAGAKDGQMYEMLSEKSASIENFMFHYNFPGFCVGEAKPVFGVGRRELGHGNLAKKALEATIDKNFGESIRLVSEILESNGSSSMASVCAGSLALKAAGVPVTKLTAGVAMGLVSSGDSYAILTDIMGLEDHDGDMDFKVAGTKDGITALQMDIKLGGIELDILKKALKQAKTAREHILELMEKAAEQIVPSKSLPLIEQFIIDPGKIMNVIGKAGATIKDIIKKFDVSIDLDRNSGNVKVSGSNKNAILDACEHIKTISSNGAGKKPSIDFEKTYKIDEVLEAKVEKIVDFGAFLALPKGGEGLLHISKLSKQRVNDVNDVLSLGQIVEIKVLKVQKERIELALAKL